MAANSSSGRSHSHNHTASRCKSAESSQWKLSIYIFPIHIHTSANNQIFHLASSSSSFSSFCENFNGIVLTIEKFIILPLIQHIFGIFPALNTFLSCNFSIHMYYADVNLIRCLIFQIIINTPFIFRILDDIQHIF